MRIVDDRLRRCHGRLRNALRKSSRHRWVCACTTKFNLIGLFNDAGSLQQMIVLGGALCLAACSSFEQTSVRGSLIDSDTPAIPQRYLGLWASPKDACFATRDYGSQIYIDQGSIGQATVRRVRSYSDYPDVVVELNLDEGHSDAHTTMFIQPSLDDKKIRVSQTGDREERIYHRCMRK
jgi:hypothetical protein